MNFIQGSNKLDEQLKSKMIDMSITESNYTNKEFIDIMTPIVCRNAIDIDEIKESIGRYNTIYTEKNNEITGIVIFKFNKKEIEIKILCSSSTAYKGNGQMLLLTVLSIATALGNERVILQPLLNYHVIQFYKKNNFIEHGYDMVYLVDRNPPKTKLLSKL